MHDTLLCDLDGTLVDTNYHHALAWARAFDRIRLVAPLWRIHRHIGMGGDQIIEAVAGRTVEETHGDELRTAWTAEFDPLLPTVKPLDGAGALLDALRQREVTVVLASSGASEHVEHYLDLLDARARVHAWTTSQDVEATKPAPDLLQVALEKAGGGDRCGRGAGRPAAGLVTTVGRA